MKYVESSDFCVWGSQEFGPSRKSSPQVILDATSKNLELMPAHRSNIRRSVDIPGMRLIDSHGEGRRIAFNTRTHTQTTPERGRQWTPQQALNSLGFKRSNSNGRSLPSLANGPEMINQLSKALASRTSTPAQSIYGSDKVSEPEDKKREQSSKSGAKGNMNLSSLSRPSLSRKSHILTGKSGGQLNACRGGLYPVLPSLGTRNARPLEHARSAQPNYNDLELTDTAETPMLIGRKPPTNPNSTVDAASEGCFQQHLYQAPKALGDRSNNKDVLDHQFIAPARKAGNPPAASVHNKTIVSCVDEEGRPRRPSLIERLRRNTPSFLLPVLKNKKSYSVEVGEKRSRFSLFRTCFGGGDAS